MANSQEQIAAQLLSTKSLPVSTTWLHNFLSSSTVHQRNIPLSALTQTALFRVLASDFRESLSTRNPSSLLSIDISDPTVQERRLQGSIPVQVLDIEDIGSSLWSQVEAIERVERGEAIRGREIVRTVNVDQDPEQEPDGNTATGGPHRVIVQDAAGTKAVAIELKRVSGMALGKLSIGAKLLLRDATVARGMVLLTPECVTLLGGKIDSLDQVWREGRKERLLARVTEMQREQDQQV
ncbi:hypothetical protein BDV29DRAFT_133814 [Aspergillus leporis]|jgi:RecQ-mediated genome instability protein 1|uniref:RecQ-mediated genome instability protein 1 n=1 Tax=Aspergillus leporis TaxID=41062 RepID=A0A5N5X338_9EURO|nr:hypothetical protein BDV29DRAFT_133814 [Aspergillus leporis]